MSRAVKVDGVAQTINALIKLDRILARKTLQKALRGGGKVFQTEAKRNAPKRSGLTRKSIVVRAAKKKRNRIAFNVQLGKKNYTGKSFYAAFVEFGTKTGRKRQKKDAPPRKVKIEARYYMKRAYDTKKAEAGKVVVDLLKKGLVEAAREARGAA